MTLGVLFQSLEYDKLALVGVLAVVLLGIGGLMTVAVFARSIKHSRWSKKRVRESEHEANAAIAEAREAAVARRKLRYQLQVITTLMPGQQPAKALKSFLKAILPHPADGFIAVIKKTPSGTEVACSRGGVPNSSVLDSLPDKNSRWYAGSKIPKAFLIPTTNEYSILTSQLAPSDIGEEDARSTMAMCADAVGEWAFSLEGGTVENVEHRMTREMLLLREIADEISSDPDASIRGYLKTLIDYQPFDRATLFLVTDDEETGRTLRRIGQAGTLVHSGVEHVASDHEQRLAMLTRESVQHFETSELNAIGVDSLIASATTTLLVSGGRVRGVLCLTASKCVTPDEPAAKLLEWVGEHLVGLLETLRDRLSMERRATRDGLTGLLNRSELDQRLAIATSQATNDQPCTLMLFDLDHFKNVNDTYGHAAGDAAIKHVANIMQSVALQMRSDDDPCVARYGGEELAILLPKAGLIAGMRIAEEVRTLVATTTLKHDGRIIPLTISAGVSSSPSHAQDGPSLLEAADAGLYASKKLGRNRVTDASDVSSLEALAEALES